MKTVIEMLEDRHTTTKAKQRAIEDRQKPLYWFLEGQLTALKLAKTLLEEALCYEPYKPS